MPTVADFVVVQDSQTTLEIGGDIDRSISFDVPDNLVVDRRALLMWRPEVEDPEALSWKIAINGTQFFDFTHGTHQIGGWDEVIDGDVLHSGPNNDFTATVLSGSGQIKFSDVVVHCQVQV